MAHTPYGYKIEAGKAVLDKDRSHAFRMMLVYYLEGMGLKTAADKAGIDVTHCQAKKMLLNNKYLGTEYYPTLMTKEEQDRVRMELKRRAEALGRIREPKEEADARLIPISFSMKGVEAEFTDPYEQAEYLYSLIEEAGTDG